MNINTQFIRNWLSSQRSVKDLYAYVCLRKEVSQKSGYVNVHLVHTKSATAGWKPGSSVFYSTLSRLVKYGLVTKVKRGVFHITSHYRIEDSRRFVQIPDSAFESIENFTAFLYAAGGRMWLSHLNRERYRSTIDPRDKASHKRDVIKTQRLTECQYALSMGRKFLGVKSDKTVAKYRDLSWALGYASGEKALSFLTDNRTEFLDWLPYHPEKARLIVMKDGAAHELLGYDQGFNLRLKFARKKNPKIPQYPRSKPAGNGVLKEYGF